MTREDYTLKLEAACKVLELERLGHVVKVAHDEMMNQARAFNQQAQLDPDFASDDTPTAGDYGEAIAQPGAKPEAIVWVPPIPPQHTA